MIVPVIRIEPIKHALAIIAEFNRIDLAEVALEENGLLLPVTAAHVDSFRITGLSNKDFIDMRFWETAESILDGDKK